MKLQDIFVPDIGEYGEVEIIEILVKIGDKINKEQSLITLETDKATMDIPCPYEGHVVELKVKLGDKVKQGDAIAILQVQDNQDDKLSKTLNEILEHKKETQNDQQSTSLSYDQRQTLSLKVESVVNMQQQGIYAGPGVRRTARELGIDLQQIKGYGRKGRITKDDVNQYVKKSLQQNDDGLNKNLNVESMPDIDFSKFGPIKKESLPRIKKLSGRFLHRNWFHVPHVTQFAEADITELENFRKKQKSLVEKQAIRLTILVFIMKSVVAGLKKFPQFNTSLDISGEHLIYKHYYHIGIAIDTKDGLVVPNIRNVDQKNILQLAQELDEISQKARNGQLTAYDMKGGCFSISSLGSIGGTAFTPIVNAPEVAILGISRSQLKPMWNNNSFEPRLVLPLSLSYDHRVIDGADGVRFTNFLVENLSDIRRLLL